MKQALIIDGITVRIWEKKIDLRGLKYFVASYRFNKNGKPYGKIGSYKEKPSEEQILNEAKELWEKLR